MPEVSFGDNVRVVRTRETEALGVAGRVGQVFGYTTPSITGVVVVGTKKGPEEGHGGDFGSLGGVVSGNAVSRRVRPCERDKALSTTATIDSGGIVYFLSSLSRSISRRTETGRTMVTPVASSFPSLRIMATTFPLAR